MFTPSVTLYIDKDNSRVRIVDTTDLSTVNLSTVGIVGSGTIISPTGDVLATGVTINRSTGATTSAWVALDVDGSGAIINGTYTLNYEYTYTLTNYAISSINGSNGIVLNGVNWTNLFTAGNSITIASSAVSGNNGVKTVVSSAFATNTTITVSQTLTAEVTTAGRLSFTITTSGFVSNVYVWSGCDVVTPSVSVTYDCDSTQFGTITFEDTTVLPSGQTLTTREFIVAFPQLLTNPTTPANQTTSLPAITIDTLATGDWVSRLNYTVSGVQSDGLTYGYTSTSGAQTTTVTCEGSLCSLSACIENLINTNKTALDTTGQSAYLSAVVTITGLIAIANEQRICGNMDAYRTTVASIRTILDSSGCDCDCCNDTTGNRWINNATFDGQSALDALQEQIDALNLTVIPLINQLASDAAALAAYNAILAQLVTATSEVSSLMAAIGTIQAALDGLNPTSPSFESDVDALEDLVAVYVTDVDTLTDTITNIGSQISLFNTNYPSYTSYTNIMLETLGQIEDQLSDTSGYLTTLGATLASLTPSSYDTDIAALQSDVNNLYNSIAAIFDYAGYLTIQMNGIQDAVSFLSQQVAANTAAIAALQQQTTITQTCFPIKQAFDIEYSDLAAYGLNSFNIPAACFTDGGYVKVVAWLANGTGVNSNLAFRNEATGDNISFLTCSANEYNNIEILVQKIPSTNNFKMVLTNAISAAGVPDSTTYAAATYSGGEILVNTAQEFSFVDLGTTPTAGIVRLEVTGYKSI
jgi:hypothetical protein